MTLSLRYPYLILYMCGTKAKIKKKTKKKKKRRIKR